MSSEAFLTYVHRVVILLILFVAVFLPLLHALLRMTVSAESADKLAYVSYSIFVFGVLFQASFSVGGRKPSGLDRLDWMAGPISWILLVLLVTSTLHMVPLPKVFGDSSVVTGMRIIVIGFVLPPVAIFVHRSASAVLRRWIFVGGIIVCLFVYLPTIFQPPWAVYDLYHSSYIVNELVAPSVGLSPGIDFSVQYTSIFGYLIALIFSPAVAIDVSIWLVTILAFLTFVFALSAFGVAERGFAQLLVWVSVPGILVANQYMPNLGALFSAIPIRLLFPAFVSVVLLHAALKGGDIKTWAAIGAFGGLGIVNNFESGMVSAVSSLSVVAALAWQAGSRAIYTRLIVVIAAVTFVLAAFALFAAFDLGRLAWFVLGFGSGHGSMPMPSFGLWVFVFAYLAIASVIALKYIIIWPSGQRRGLAALTLFWSLFGMGFLPYYVNRSSVFGQLQIAFFPLFLSGFGAFALIMHLLPDGSRRFRGLAFLLSLPLAVSLASLMHLPSWRKNISRLSADRPLLSRYAEVVDSVRDADKALRLSGVRVGLFCDYGNLISVATGLPTYLSVNTRGDYEMLGVRTDPKVCQNLTRDGIDVVLVDGALGKNGKHLLAQCGFSHVGPFNDFKKPIVVFSKQGVQLRQLDGMK